MAQSPEIRFGTKSGSKYEKGIVERMQALLKKHDLSKWIFTDTVLVEDYVIPHSHPVLTLNTRKMNDDHLLSTFLHEQIHWYCDNHLERTEKAMDEFKTIYPEVPVGRPDGAKSEYSTYLHLIVNYLEYQGMVFLVGKERAIKVMEEMNHYKWIYRQVLEQTTRLEAVVKKHKLDLLNQ